MHPHATSSSSASSLRASRLKQAISQAAPPPSIPAGRRATNAEFRKSQEDQINQLLLTITILLMLSIVIAVLGIAITLALGVFERTREIGLLRAVGMNRRQLRRSVRWEAVIVSTFGALVGIVLGTFLGIVASLAVPDDIVSKLAFSPMIIVVVMVFAVLAGLVAALYPSFKASNMDVLESNRHGVNRSVSVISPRMTPTSGHNCSHGSRRSPSRRFGPHLPPRATPRNVDDVADRWIPTRGCGGLQLRRRGQGRQGHHVGRIPESH